MASPLSTSLRTHTTQEMSQEVDGTQVTLTGFYGGRINDLEPHFDLMDRFGMVRVFFPSDDPTEGKRALSLGAEDVVQVVGVVAGNAPDEPALKQVRVLTFQVLNKARGLPFNPRGALEPAQKNLHGQFHHLILRNKLNQDRLQFRGLLSLAIRRHLQARSFLELETPLLAPFFMESTESFPVPAGGYDCFALPTSPQLYKQLLMMGGCDRSFQFARCFRRQASYGPWHQPEFTALDVEMSFVNEGDIYGEVDRLMGVILGAAGVQKGGPIARLSHREAMDRYGTERPDLRFDLAIQDVTDIAARSHSAVIRTLLKGARGPGGCVRAIRIKGSEASALSSDLLNTLSDGAGGLKGVGVSWLKVEADHALSGPLSRGFSHVLSEDLMGALSAQAGDTLVMIISTHRDVGAIAAGKVRTFLGKRLGLIVPGKFALAWVYEIPFFVYDPRGDCFVANRHALTQVLEEDMAHLRTIEEHRKEGPAGASEDADPTEAIGTPFDRMVHTYKDPETEARRRLRSKGFELVMNGEEIGTGSIRNHDAALQRRIFSLLDFDASQIETQFSVLLRALQHGAPPHGGLAIGFDRIIAILLHAKDIREVLPFPKDERGRCLLTKGPRAVDAEHVQALLGVAPFEVESEPCDEPVGDPETEAVPPSLNAAFNTQPNPVYVGQAVTFIDLSQSLSPIVDWLWSCPKLKWRSTERQPKKTFRSAGEYTVTLTVMNADGLRASARFTVVVHRPKGIPRYVAV